MMMMEDIKKEINNSLKKIQENTCKQLEALKEEAQKSLKELQKNTTKQVKELNKTIQDLKMEIETIKKSQRRPLWKQKTQERSQEPQMQAYPTEYKRKKRESQVQKLPQKILTLWSNKIQ